MARRKGRIKQIDLHGKTVEEAIDFFITHSNSFLATGQRGHIRVIHGYGSTGYGCGEIKRRLRELVKRWADYFEPLRCDDSMPGETWVVPLKPFPRPKGVAQSLEQQICAFCQSKKTEKQVFQRFRKRSEQELWKLLFNLRSKNLLEVVVKKGEAVWRVPMAFAGR